MDRNIKIRSGRYYIVYENANKNAFGKLFNNYGKANNYALMRISSGASYCTIWNIDTTMEYVETVQKYNHRT
jgi:hypothetical protein